MKMKNFAGVVGACFATCFAAPVLAQSSVQIYGIADIGIHKTKGERAKVASGIADGSRLGFKGTEDIGGGFKAVFNLEARIELDTGRQQPTLITENMGLYMTRGMGAFPAPILAAMRNAIQPKGTPSVNPENSLFDRTAMVGLITPVGAVLAGRMYTPGYEIFAAADTFESGTGGTWGGITQGTAGYTAIGIDIRSQESVQYRIQLPSGINASLMYGAKQSGYLGRYNRFAGAMVQYRANGWDVGIGHNRGDDQFGRESLVSTTVGGSYSIDAWKLFAGYHTMRNRNSAILPDLLTAFNGQIVPALRGAGLQPAQVAGLTQVFNTNIAQNTQIDGKTAQVGLHYRVGAGRVMASVAKLDDRRPANSDATLLALGYDHNLSKRTDVYTVLSSIRNQNAGQFTPGTAGSPGGFALVPGDDNHAMQVGIRHRF
jgi:predicted porin